MQSPQGLQQRIETNRNKPLNWKLDPPIPHSDPAYRSISGLVAITANRTATLHITGLSSAPSGKTYEAWVIPKGTAPRPAALFSGGGSTSVHLSGTVPPNAVVAVTLERAGGVPAPTTTPIFAAST